MASLQTIILKLMIACLMILPGWEQNKPDCRNAADGNRLISFSGYNWLVDDSGMALKNPGGNFFSSSVENVRIDMSGRLRLSITSRDDRWYCAGVSLPESLGYGRYIFHLATRPSMLDRNVVGGLFLYQDDRNEIDIELARWGEEVNSNSHFVIQPSVHAGNICSFDADFRGRRSTWVIDWSADRVYFSAYRGYHDDTPGSGKIISEWSYTGKDIPKAGLERVMINLWLFRGNPPADGRQNEIVVRSFEFKR